MVAGGAQVYAAALPDADHQVLTEVHLPEGDMFYPTFDARVGRDTGETQELDDRMLARDADWADATGLAVASESGNARWVAEALGPSTSTGDTDLAREQAEDANRRAVPRRRQTAWPRPDCSRIGAATAESNDGPGSPRCC